MKVANHFLYTLIIILFSVTTSCKKTESSIPKSPTIPANYKLPPVYNSSLTYGSMQDQEGNTYKTIKIGTQTWMAENLKATKYKDGTAIPQSTTVEAWVALKTGSYCVFENVMEAKDIFGALYNWYAVSTGKLCPTGWHVPTDAEWTDLTFTLGGLSVAGGKMKEVGLTHWEAPNTDATNSSGFTGLGSATIDNLGTFGDFGKYGIFWSSTENNASNAWTRTINNNNGGIFRADDNKGNGFCVRCLGD